MTDLREAFRCSVKYDDDFENKMQYFLENNQQFGLTRLTFLASILCGLWTLIFGDEFGGGFFPVWILFFVALFVFLFLRRWWRRRAARKIISMYSMGCQTCSVTVNPQYMGRGILKYDRECGSSWKENWGWEKKSSTGKYSFTEEKRIEIFDFIIGEIRKYSDCTIALCKESAKVWETLDLNLSTCSCVCQLDYANMFEI